MRLIFRGLCLVLAVAAIRGDDDAEESIAREVEDPNAPEVLIAPRPDSSGDAVSQGLPLNRQPQRDDYSEVEEAFIEGLRSLNGQDRNGLGDNIRKTLNPRCYFENWTAACCISPTIPLLGRNGTLPAKTCVETGIQAEEMRVFAGLYFNDVELYGKEYRLGKLCWFLPPPLDKVEACIWVYHMYESLEKKEVEVCTVLELGSVLHVGLNCLKFSNGKFSIADEPQPDEHGLIDIRLVGGVLKFEVESPVGRVVKYWFQKAWSNFRGLFRNKSKKFIEWLKKKFHRS